MEKKRLILTVGLPLSGKTTWVKEQGKPIVNPDSIRLALHGHRFLQSAEPFVWAIAYLMARALFLAGCKDVIVDATNISRARRDKWVERFADVEVSVVCFDVSEKECITRAELDGDKKIIPIIRRMAKNRDFLESGVIWKPLERR